MDDMDKFLNDSTVVSHTIFLRDTSLYVGTILDQYGEIMYQPVDLVVSFSDGSEIRLTPAKPHCGGRYEFNSIDHYLAMVCHFAVTEEQLQRLRIGEISRIEHPIRIDGIDEQLVFKLRKIKKKRLFQRYDLIKNELENRILPPSDSVKDDD